MKLAVSSSENQTLSVSGFEATSPASAVKLIRGQLDAAKALWPDELQHAYFVDNLSKKPK